MEQELGKKMVSIITVSFNSVKTIEKTILSVLNQTYKNIEYIIIDGGSTDGTIDIIKKYNDRISYWISEKDNGIYDAMNKGTLLSHGEYLNFMNSDDYFFNDSVIEECVPFLDNEYDIIYGDTELRNEYYNKIIEANPLKYFWEGVNHQSVFIKKETMLKYKYDIKYKISADQKFLLSVYYNNGKIKKINKIISSYYCGGYSTQNLLKATIEHRKLNLQLKNNYIIQKYYLLKIIKIIIIKIIKRLLSNKLYFKIKINILDKIFKKK